MRCATHPEVETNLRCNRCGKPICPKCLIQTPVGARCRECAQLRRLPIFEVSFQHYLMALAVGFSLGLASGFFWLIFGGLIPFSGFLVPLGAGYLIGETISRSVNRKRSPALAAIAAGALFLSYLVSHPGLFRSPLLVAGWFDFYGLIGLAVGIALAVSLLR